MQIHQSINRKALTIAVTSFILGTIILALYLTTGSEAFLIGGLFYVLVALAINTITLVGIVANAIINFHYYKENLTTILLFLINIPVALGYVTLIIKNPTL